MQERNKRRSLFESKLIQWTILVSLFGGFVYLFSRPSDSKPAAIVEQQDQNEKPTTEIGTASKNLTPNIVNAPTADSRINEFAIMEMTPKSFPKMYSRIGATAFKRANILIKPAALKALESPKCDRVEIVSFSEKSTSKNIRYFVDCQNGERILVDEVDLKSGNVVLTEHQKAKSISDTQAIQLCIAHIKRRLNFPSTFDSSWYKQGTYRSKSNSTVTVTIDFTAKTGFGLELPASAKCVVSQDGLKNEDVTIYEG